MSSNTGSPSKDPPPDLVEQVREAVRAELAAERRRVAAPEPMLRVEDCAEVLGMSERFVQTIIHSGELGSVKIGRARRVPPEALESYLRRCAGGDGR